MEKRTLGRTGLNVSLLTLGCGAVGGLMPKGDPADQMQTVQRALELGVNFFDTAPLYGNGTSETNLGHILKELNPDIILGTKVRIAPDQRGNIAEAVAQSMEDSLKRLQRDHVDLLQLHNPLTAEGDGWDLTADIALQEVVPALQRMQRDGKTRFIGMTAIGDTPSLQAAVDSGAFDTAQIVYNALNPSSGSPVADGYPGQDYEQLLKRATTAGVGTIAIRAVAGGALSGDEARHPLGMPVVAPIGSGKDYATDVARALKLKPALEASDCSDLIELGIRYVAGHPDVSTLQVGIATTQQFEGAASAVNKGALPQDVLARVAEIQSGYIGDGL